MAKPAKLPKVMPHTGPMPMKGPMPKMPRKGMPK